MCARVGTSESLIGRLPPPILEKTPPKHLTNLLVTVVESSDSGGGVSGWLSHDAHLIANYRTGEMTKVAQPGQSKEEDHQDGASQRRLPLESQRAVRHACIVAKRAVWT